MESSDSLEQTISTINEFVEERDWNQFHSPKSLAMSISIEAAELLENFQWSKDDEPLSTTNKESISEELADVLIYAIRLCEVLEVDPIEISNKKIDKNPIKYPVDISKGISEKNTKLYIDPLSELHLLGTSIDYVTEDFSSGEFESKFKFGINKELMTSCGCGVSFSPKGF